MAQVHSEIYEALVRASSARLAFTRRAFRLLPQLDHPRILDVGCGRGGPTLELARLSNGEVIGLDIDRTALDELSAAIEEHKLSDRVRAVRRSMSDMGFEPAGFDVVWAEASIHVLGLEEGLDVCRPLLKRGGFLVIHEMAWLRPHPPRELADYWRRFFSGIGTVDRYAAEAARHGYEVLDSFALPEDFWWEDYFLPLERKLRELRDKYRGDEETLAVLEREQGQVDMVKRHRGWFGSVFLVLRRVD
jgi:SAM-dependent methyltransferase